MAKKPKKNTRPESSTTPTDVAVLRCHLAIDDIQDTLKQRCYKTEDVSKALDLVSWLRHFIPKTVKENFAD